MKVGFLITARTKSTRLPKKIIRVIAGKPIIVHMLDRIKMAKEPEVIVICTSIYKEDDVLEEIAKQEHVECYRGHPDDVLQRLLAASKYFRLDYIVNITADCPFVGPEYIDKTVKLYEKTNADLIKSEELPHGAYCYGIKPKALEKVCEIKDEIDTEVWGGYFTDTGLFHVESLHIDDKFKRPELRMTLDYEEDLRFFEVVFKYLYEPGKVFSLEEIINLLDSHPEVVEINAHCEAKFEEHLKKSPMIKLKNNAEVIK